MKIHRKFLYASLILTLAILACNLPGSTSNGDGSNNPDTSIPTTDVPTEASVPTAENTPAPTATETAIPITDTPQVPPEIKLTKNSNCRVGPSTFFNIVDQIAAGTSLPVIGRNEDNSWWQVVNATGHECWIFNENALPNSDLRAIQIGESPALPGVPANFFVTDQLCQPGPKKFSVTLSWSSGGGETSFNLYRDGNKIGNIKASKFNYKDTNAPLNKNLTYEIESVNENGTSQRAVQIVAACK
ncbi:MAG TPA: SH3 domain-containing protein [Anaerolineales bacterium]|nr:SH3 domain-containing protein [Anaerolineales bacterium]